LLGIGGAAALLGAILANLFQGFLNKWNMPAKSSTIC
jgi:hypothetical protein